MNKFTEIGFAGIFGGCTGVILQAFFDNKVNGITAFVYVMLLFILTWMIGSVTNLIESKIIKKR